jgi:hypothetical protein
MQMSKYVFEKGAETIRKVINRLLHSTLINALSIWKMHVESMKEVSFTEFLVSPWRFSQVNGNHFIVGSSNKDETVSKDILNRKIKLLCAKNFTWYEMKVVFCTVISLISTFHILGPLSAAISKWKSFILSLYLVRKRAASRVIQREWRRHYEYRGRAPFMYQVIIHKAPMFPALK